MLYLKLLFQGKRSNIHPLRGLGLSLLTFFLIVSIAFFVPSYAIDIQDVPNPREVNGGWVSDTANLLSYRTETQLNQWIDELEAYNGAEIAVVTVPKTQPAASPKEFATELFNTWKIGKVDEENGILFLVSSGDRRVEIETGYGIEGILPDGRVGQIIDEQIIPQFKQGNVEGGILAGTRKLVNIASEGKLPTTSETTSAPAPVNPAPAPINPTPAPVNPAPANNTSSVLAKPASLQLFFFTALLGMGLAGFNIWQLKRLLKNKILIPATDYKRFGKLDESDRIPRHILRLAVFCSLLAFSLLIFGAIAAVAPSSFFLFASGWIWFTVILFVCAQWSCSGLTVMLGLIIAFTIWLVWIGFQEALVFDYQSVFQMSAIASFFVTFPLAKWIWPNLIASNEGERKSRPFHCATCQEKMERVTDSELSPLLTQIERATRELIEIKYEGWRCPSCHPELTRENINLRVYSSHIPSDVETCPTCKDYTVKRTSTVIRKATYSQSGERLIEKKCHSCDYHKEWTKTIPQKTTSSSSSSSSYDYDSSSSSSSSGGDSFGGGSSGGGGAGGDW